MPHNIQVSHESPISILDQSVSYNDYDYALVHLFDTHPEYYQFFKKSLARGRQVLLDNSIFELGKSFEPAKFAKYVEELKPSFYIVPDVLEDAYETVKSFADFTKQYPTLPGIKIGAVQGKTYDELVDCYKYMSECNGRQNFIQDLINDGVWNWSKPHHLLGCSLAKEFRYYVDKVPNIRSCDTSNPVVAGIKGIRYNGDLGLQDKPSQKLADLIEHKVNDKEIIDIVYNAYMFKKIINR